MLIRKRGTGVLLSFIHPSLLLVVSSRFFSPELFLPDSAEVSTSSTAFSFLQLSFLLVLLCSHHHPSLPCTSSLHLCVCVCQQCLCCNDGQCLVSLWMESLSTHTVIIWTVCNCLSQCDGSLRLSQKGTCPLSLPLFIFAV